MAKNSIGLLPHPVNQKLTNQEKKKKKKEKEKRKNQKNEKSTQKSKLTSPKKFEEFLDLLLSIKILVIFFG